MHAQARFVATRPEHVEPGEPFHGLFDVDLSPQGLAEARESGRLLREEGYDFDVVYTSLLKRAIRTMWIALDEWTGCGCR